jgi:ribosomal protein L11 methyltransferase
VKSYPALSVSGADADLVAALVDDFSPTAIEPRDSDVRVFFATSADREAAHRALSSRFGVAALEVSDEDWARRSQENLQPIVVGRLTVFPSPESRTPTPGAIIIRPSMGFGTGHHATTRLCLDALQATDLTGREVLDVGTGSGVLAIAAVLLGAAHAVGVDVDADAIESARENLALNPSVRGVEFAERDLMGSPLPDADIVTANLTGAMLVRSASALAGAVRARGTLILSGILVHERDEVRRAFAALRIVWERQEDGWVGIAARK